MKLLKSLETRPSAPELEVIAETLAALPRCRCAGIVASIWNLVRKVTVADI